MDPSTVIFFGMQGSGKGTQAGMLDTYLRERDGEDTVLHFEAGQHFRSFMSESGYTNEKVNRSVNAGNIQPAFIPTHFWAKEFIDKLDDNTHLIMDGSPRALLETKVFDTAMDFYDRNVHVIKLDISEETAIERLLGRGREDDTEESIKKRIGWYKEQVLPTLDYLRENDRYLVHDINGEKNIDDIHDSILTILNLKDE